jgi:hypothetical protein
VVLEQYLTLSRAEFLYSREGEGGGQKMNVKVFVLSAQKFYGRETNWIELDAVVVFADVIVFLLTQPITDFLEKMIIPFTRIDGKCVGLLSV